VSAALCDARFIARRPIRGCAKRLAAEAALAHVTGDKAERAYRRGDALEKRRQLMAEWAAFVGAL
jgi:hypothetical protein